MMGLEAISAPSKLSDRIWSVRSSTENCRGAPARGEKGLQDPASINVYSKSLLDTRRQWKRKFSWPSSCLGLFEVLLPLLFSDRRGLHDKPVRRQSIPILSPPVATRVVLEHSWRWLSQDTRNRGHDVSTRAQQICFYACFSACSSFC